MAASRRAQIQSLCGVRTGPLIDRVESYLAAVDIWSRRGNAKAVKNAGTGIVAICCYLAAESLDLRVPDRTSAIRASGLPPTQFASAERDFRTAVQSVSSAPSHALSGPSDVANSAFAASLSAATPATASPSSKGALLAKAQAVQSGSLFDQTMRAASDAAATTAAPTQAKAMDTDVAASTAFLSDAVSASAEKQTKEQVDAETRLAELPPEMQFRRRKRRRMGRVVFGLAIHSSLNRLDGEEEANDECQRRNRIHHIQSTIERLRSSNPTWRYLDAPRDFLVTISPSPLAEDRSAS